VGVIVFWVPHHKQPYIFVGFTHWCRRRGCRRCSSAARM